jgi:hypothetical protein
MKLLLTSLGVLFFAAMVFGSLRMWGLGQNYQPYNHPFLTDVGSSNPALSVKIPFSESEAQAAISLAPQVILFLDVRMSKDEILFVQEKGLLEPLLTVEKMGPERYQGDRPYFYPFNTLKTYFPDLIEVRTFLQRFPQQKFILNVQDNAQNIHVVVMKLLKEANAAARVLIQSDIDVIIKSIREEEPTWCYGSSLPEITRILSLQSVGLEMVPSIRADVWLTPLKFKKRLLFNEALGNEVRRRFKKVFLGPLSTSEEVFAAQRYNPDGFIFSGLSILEEFLKKKESL